MPVIDACGADRVDTGSTPTCNERFELVMGVDNDG